MLRPLQLALLLIAALSAQASAQDAESRPSQTHRAQVSSRQCGLGTSFNVLADSGGIWLYRDNGIPREVFFHAGELSIDHQVQPIGAADRERLRKMEEETRLLMPQVSGLAHEVIDLSYDALGGVVQVLTGSWLNARKIERLRRRASDYVDGTLGKGRWEQQAFDGNFERYVEQEADSFKGSIARHMMWQIATGRADGIDARAQAMDSQLDARLDTRARTIETSAAALCGHVQTLRRLQDALDVRYQGQALQLLDVDPEGNRASNLAAARKQKTLTERDTADDNALQLSHAAQPAADNR
ncbi:YggN family protein [Xanthomonas prunicola]|uniref:YggN family protein n=1 Tax=Xanthomonas prunicola TaxID=2053930 RepID=UPI0021B2579E|nr:YggN family protein [Xanthomonas prunicola]UXA52658.1 YggN family protein [Xanthomonas prunicola]